MQVVFLFLFVSCPQSRILTIRDADAEALSKVSGMTPQSAESVYAFFHPKE